MAAKVNYNAVAMKRSYTGCAMAISLCALVLYTVTLLPDIDWSEGARAQLNAYLGRASSMPEGHPLYFWLGFLLSRFPGLDPAWLINFSSALYGAAALFLFAMAGFEVLEALSDVPAGAWSSPDMGAEASTSVGIAENVPAQKSDRKILNCAPVLLATASLAVSWTFWFCSTHPRPISLNGVVLMAAVYFAVALVRKRRIEAVFPLCFILGLSAAVHWMTLLLSPIFIVTIVAVFREHKVKLTKGSIVGAAGSLALGLLPFFAALLQDLARWRQPVLVLAMASGVVHEGWHPWTPHPISMMKEAATFSAYNFFPWGIAIGMVGIWQLLRRRMLLFLLLAGCFASALLLSFIARDAERAIYYHPAWMLFALFLVPGWYYLLGHSGRLIWPASLVVILIPPVFYQYAPRSWQPDTAPGQSRPEPCLYYLNPSGRTDRSAGRFGADLLHKLPPHARLLAYYRVDPSTYSIVQFLQRTKHLRPDVSVDQLRGYDGVVSLKHLFQLHPEIQTLCILSRHPLYDATDTDVVESPGKSWSVPEFQLVQIRRKEAPELTTPLEEGNSNWRGYMTVFEPTLGLRAIWRDDLWFFRLRFKNPLLYPHEGRVDHLRVESGSVFFTYAGFDFAGRIFGDTMLGEWWTSSVPEFHGEWRIVRSGKDR